MHEMRMHKQVTCIGFPEHKSALLHLTTTFTFRAGLIPRSPVDVLHSLRQPFHVIMLGWTSLKGRKRFLRFSFLLRFFVWLIRHYHKGVVAGVINDPFDMKMFHLRRVNRIITDNVPDALLPRNSLAKKQQKR